MNKQALKNFLHGVGRDAIVADEAVSEDTVSLVSSVGGIPWGRASEAWPQYDGRPLIPILSVVAHELPYLPAHLDGVALLNVFADREESPLDERNGSIVIRVYESLTGLQPLTAPQLPTRHFNLSWRRVTDYPHHAHLSVGFDNEAAALVYRENWKELNQEFPNHAGIKIGGWAHLIQDVRFLAKDDPRYVLQIDGTEIFQYCDAGMGYLMRSNLEWSTHWETM